MNKLLQYNKKEEFSPNIYVQKKDNFEDTNNTINNLNEQIIILKKKADLLFEKDKEIEKLKKSIKQISKENNDQELNKMIIDKQNIELKRLKDTLSEYTKSNIDLKKKNNILSKKLISYRNIISNNSNIIDKEKIKNAVNQRLKDNNNNKIDKLISNML